MSGWVTGITFNNEKVLSRAAKEDGVVTDLCFLCGLFVKPLWFFVLTFSGGPLIHKRPYVNPAIGAAASSL